MDGKLKLLIFVVWSLLGIFTMVSSYYLNQKFEAIADQLNLINAIALEARIQAYKCGRDL